MKYKILLFPAIAVLFFTCKLPKTSTDNNHEYTNALAGESSPYLLQHAHNPVNWYPWGEEALAKAKAEDKLIIISIGYAACHWCHVMEHESFEDTTVARIMNENFINIKVDREERPDVDDVYMTACQLSSGRGCGWPLNSIALPDSRPVWAGTYFPRDEWLKILNGFKKSKENDYDNLVGYADRLAEGIKSTEDIVFNEADRDFPKEELGGFAAAFAKNADSKKGGIRSASPKFPMPSVWEFALAQNDETPNPDLKNALAAALDNMANGGIYDHLGGGFARYSVDADWHVPHFEKMLYDNAQLVSLFSKAFQATKNPMYRRTVEETLEFIERELTDKSGGFYSSLDADSEGEEGKFYVWTKEEVDSILGESPEKKHFIEYYDVKKRGNWEHGKNVLRRLHSLAEMTKKFNVSEEDFLTSIEASKTKMMSARDTRVRPGLDDKVLTSWNGLMLQGFCDAYRAFGNEAYRQTAIRNGEFLVKNMMQPDGRLNRNYKDGKSVINAFLDDYAAAANGFIALYQITFDEVWLNRAKQLADYTRAHFKDEKTGMFFYTSDQDADLIVRKKELSDNVIPASNSMMARALHALGTYLYKPEMQETAAQMLNNMKPQFQEGSETAFYSNWLRLWLDLSRSPYEVAIVGDDWDAKRKAISANYIPNAFLLGGKTEGTIELLKDKLQEGETMIYVCQNKVCKLPVTEVEKALKLF